MTFEICKEMMAEGFKGNMTEAIKQCSFVQGFFGGMFGGLLILGIALAIIFGIGIYVYFALAWQTIAKKLKHKNAWIAWIPIANIALMLQLGKFNWKWVFLILIPVLGWFALFVLVIIATWRIFEKRKYPGWLSLSMILPKVGGIIYLIVIGFVAWGKKK